jgi:hypothetical protein
MDASSENFTVKEIVLDIRSDVKQLALQINRIDREGSIGTKAELSDKEARIRTLEREGSRLSGVWATLTLIGAFTAGAAGLILGAFAYLGT